MKRREFVTLLGGAPRRGRLWRARSRRGCTRSVLYYHNDLGAAPERTARGPARHAGYVRGPQFSHTLGCWQTRSPVGKGRRTGPLDLIVTFFTPSAVAAKQATRDIPIVMAGAGDPVAAGLVASLARPAAMSPSRGGGAEVAGRSVELIRGSIPAARHLGVLADESDPFSKSYVAHIGQAARSAGMTVQYIMTSARTTARSRIRDTNRRSRRRAPHSGKHRAQGIARLGDQISLAGIDISHSLARARGLHLWISVDEHEIVPTKSQNDRGERCGGGRRYVARLPIGSSLSQHEVACLQLCGEALQLDLEVCVQIVVHVPLDDRIASAVCEEADLTRGSKCIRSDE